MSNLKRHNRATLSILSATDLSALKRSTFNEATTTGSLSAFFEWVNIVASSPSRKFWLTAVKASYLVFIKANDPNNVPSGKTAITDRFYDDCAKYGVNIVKADESPTDGDI